MKGLGWIPDPVDDRDRLICYASALSSAPGSKDVGEQLPGVLNQGGENSCVVQSVATIIYCAHVRSMTPPFELVSRKALWYYGRADTGREALNVGQTLRGAMFNANALGFCRERHWPHGQPFDQRPSVHSARMCADQRNRGLGRVVYERLDESYSGKLAAMRAAIAAGLPFAFGVDVSSDFAGNRFDASQPVDPPVYDIAGGHAMVCYGYRDDGAFRIRNSWGSGWGDRGDCWFSADYMMQASDLWTVPSAPNFSDTV